MTKLHNYIYGTIWVTIAVLFWWQVSLAQDQEKTTVNISATVVDFATIEPGGEPVCISQGEEVDCKDYLEEQTDEQRTPDNVEGYAPSTR